MLFNSIAFAIFLPIVLAITFLLERQNLYKKIFLILASFYFYMYWKASYGWLLFGSIALNYLFVAYICKAEASGDKPRKRMILTIAVVANLLFLSVFKYANFFINNINSVAPYLKLSPLSNVDIVLPIGISFFTFQALSYVIDVYKKRHKKISFIDTSLYLSFFPHLIAGPIIRANQIADQFNIAKIIKKDDLVIGSQRIFWGLIKKMVIADNLAIFVNQVFANHGDYGWVTILLAVYSFAFQIYCDFSGYSDIAIGCFRIMGYRIPENFNLPYVASGFSDFWKRWHISLSSWLKDYLYIPLGGNRKGISRTYLNLLITMFLGGLWHGAKWTFVVWGILHGLFLILERVASKRIKLPENAFTYFLSAFITFQLVSFAWIFFRAQDITSAMSIAGSIFTLKAGNLFVTWPVIALLIFSSVSHILKGRYNVYGYFMSLPYYLRYAAYSAGIFLLFFNKSGVSSQFIYFQF